MKRMYPEREPKKTWRSPSSVLVIPNRQHSSFAGHFIRNAKLRGGSPFCGACQRAFRQVEKEVERECSTIAITRELHESRKILFIVYSIVFL